MAHGRRSIIIAVLVTFGFVHPRRAEANPFSFGNLVVVRIGDGSRPPTQANPVFLDEYTTSGVLVQSVPMPTDFGDGYPLTLTFLAVDGFLTRSSDGQSLLL